MIFCRHKWDLVSKTTTKPWTTRTMECSLPTDEAIKVLLGTTTLVLKCKKCSKIKVIEMLGEEVEQIVVNPATLQSNYNVTKGKYENS